MQNNEKKIRSFETKINETKFFYKIVIDNIDRDGDITCNNEKKITCDNVIFGETTTNNEKFEINFRNTITANFCFENICDNNNLNKKNYIKNLFNDDNVIIYR